RSDQAGGATVAAQDDRVPAVQPRQSSLRNKETNKDVLRRQDRDDRRSGRHGFAGLGQHIGDAAAYGRGNGALCQPPLGHRERRLGGGDRGALSLDFGLSAHRCLGLRQRRLGGLHFGFRRALVGTPLIDTLRRGISVAQQG